jgi:hypothetical protein
MQCHFHRTVASFAIAASLSLLTSCISVERTGSSSGQMKKAMEASFLFKSADIFYPDGKIPEDPSTLPRLGPESVRLIQRTVDSLVKGTIKTHDELETLFGAREFKMNVRLDNKGMIAAQVDETGELLLDVKIVQALYRAAIVSAFRAEIDLARVRNDVAIDAPLTAADQDLAIAKLLEIRQEVRQTRGKSMVGDLASSMRDDMEGSWFSMSRLAEQSERAQAHYVYQLLFLVSHETGHMALGHHEGSLAPDDCQGFRDREEEADLYAAIQVAMQTRQMAAYDMFGMMSPVPSASSGIKDFFELAYTFSGFDSVQHSAGCQYAPPEERLKAANEVFAVVRSGQIDHIWSQALKDKTK